MHHSWRIFIESEIISVVFTAVFWVFEYLLFGEAEKQPEFYIHSAAVFGQFSAVIYAICRTMSLSKKPSTTLTKYDSNSRPGNRVVIKKR